MGKIEKFLSETVSGFYMNKDLFVNSTRFDAEITSRIFETEQ